MAMDDQIRVREGQRNDLPRVLELVRELAAFERAPHEVTNTLEMMERDGFGPAPVYGLFVADGPGGIVGISVYYYRYSTWKGKRLYLEDIVVSESERGRGIGQSLFEITMRKALQEHCTGMMWQVLDWNEPAINFYKKFGARFDAEWINVNLEATQIEQWLGQGS
jgi:GNAT superfamily N-acetyltransferase